MKSFSLLIVEDDRREVERLKRTILRREPLAEIYVASSPVAAVNQFRKHQPEIVLLDLSLTGESPESGLSVLSQLVQIDPRCRIIVLTGHVTDRIGQEAVLRGASSYVTKPVDIQSLFLLLCDSARTAKLLRKNSPPSDEAPVHGFIGRSAAMRKVYDLIHECAATESNVLILGETGTGKELAAHAIHQLSSRCSGPLSIYFGSVPSNLAEAELFGYVRGAFTGAAPSGAAGCIRAADGGTLFLDEVCSLDLSIQRKLLRTVEDKSFKPLGSDHLHYSYFRLVAAAQPIIYEMVRRGEFREDLLSRLEVLTIHLPPLRERREDILDLVRYFQTRVNRDFEAVGMPSTVREFSNEVIHAFQRYVWPRNVRQLFHVVQHSMLQAQLRGARRVEIIDLGDRLNDLDPELGFRGVALKPGMTLRSATERLERSMIIEALQRNDNAISRTCQELGIGRTTLWRKVKQYRLANVLGDYR